MQGYLYEWYHIPTNKLFFGSTHLDVTCLVNSDQIETSVNAMNNKTNYHLNLHIQVLSVDCICVQINIQRVFNEMLNSEFWVVNPKLRLLP